MEVNLFKEIDVNGVWVEVEATFNVNYDEIETLGYLRLTPGQGDLPKAIQTEAAAKNPRDVFTDEEIFAFTDKVKEKEARRFAGGY